MSHACLVQIIIISAVFPTSHAFGYVMIVDYTGCNKMGVYVIQILDFYNNFCQNCRRKRKKIPTFSFGPVTWRGSIFGKIIESFGRYLISEKQKQYGSSVG